jgi:hypothetical protein
MLSLALYCEGNTDKRFLPTVITKTSKQILDKHKRNSVQVLPIQVIEIEKKRQREAILLAAKRAVGYHILIVHADADHPKADKARLERFEPGYKLVQQTNEDVCKDLLPIIPVQAIEAWMLADYELLLEEIGTKMNAYDLGIPTKASLVESIAKPKRKIYEVVRKAYASRSKRQREVDIDFLSESIGERISLERLRQVPAYQQFVNDLTETLKKLNFIH